MASGVCWFCDKHAQVANLKVLVNFRVLPPRFHHLGGFSAAKSCIAVRVWGSVRMNASAEPLVAYVLIGFLAAA